MPTKGVGAEESEWNEVTQPSQKGTSYESFVATTTYCTCCCSVLIRMALLNAKYALQKVDNMIYKRIYYLPSSPVDPSLLHIFTK